MVVGAGAVGVEAQTPRGRRALRKIGLTSSPDASFPRPAGLRRQDGSLTSSHLPTPAAWSIGWPPEALGPPVGVVVCLHGRGADHRFAFDDVRIPEAVAASPTPLVVASVDGGTNSYWHPRRDGTDARAMLLDEFLPLVEQAVGRLPIAVMGWSMGGYGALLAAATRPGRFVAVVASSPALWTDAAQSTPGSFDGPADFGRYDVFALRSELAALPVRVDCGEQDPFQPAAKAFADGLPGPHEATFGPGFHDAAYWRSVAAAQLAGIAAAIRR